MRGLMRVPYLCRLQAAADLASRQANQTATLDALFELLFRWVQLCEEWVGGCVGWKAACAFWPASPAVTRHDLRVPGCRVLKNCSTSGLVQQPDGRRAAEAGPIICLSQQHDCARRQPAVWHRSRLLDPAYPLPAAAAAMSRRHFMKKFPLLFPALRVLSKFVHLIR